MNKITSIEDINALIAAGVEESTTLEYKSDINTTSDKWKGEMSKDVSAMANANFIVLMGVSLGETDLYWWELIGKNIINRKNLALIQHIYNSGAILPTQMQKRGRLERRQQEVIMQKMRINEENWTDELRERLFFTVNAPIFKM